MGSLLNISIVFTYFPSLKYQRHFDTLLKSIAIGSFFKALEVFCILDKLKRNCATKAFKKVTVVDLP